MRPLVQIGSGSDYASATRDLYNGNINSMLTGLTLPDPIQPTTMTTQMQAMAYHYDQLNRITQAQAFDNYNPGTKDWSPNAGTVAHTNYRTQYEYDGNGNILKLKRNGDQTVSNTLYNDFDMDYLDYDYGSGTHNKLLSVEDHTSLTSHYDNDIDDAINYTYDKIGQLIDDGSVSVTWDVYNKIKEIEFASPGSGEPKYIRFEYGPMGNRISKEVIPDGVNGEDFATTTYYIRDASGNIMSTYEQTNIEVPAGTMVRWMRQKEVNLYGSSRLGSDGVYRLIQQWDRAYPGTSPFTSVSKPSLQAGPKTTHVRRLGYIQYELTNHLGNVLATVSDKKIVIADGDPQIDGPFYYLADQIFVSDYYPFGMQMPGRTYNAGGYRFGFNGMEGDDEMYGQGNSYDFGARIYDSRVGRWLSRDPFEALYPYSTTYGFGLNNPIANLDPDGNKVWVNSSTKEHMSGDKKVIETTHTIDITLAILDVADGTIDGEKLANLVESKLKSAIAQTEAYSVSVGDTEMRHVFKTGSISVAFRDDINDVGSAEHLAVIVDEAIDSKNPDGSPRPAGGWGEQPGKVSYVERLFYGSSLEGLAKSIIHELGHNMGMAHEKDENGNVVTTGTYYMSYSTNRINFNPRELLGAVADKNKLNEANNAPNTVIVQKETNNWLWHNSTNEEPWDFNVKKGDKIPKPIKTPSKTNDTHKN